MSTIVHTKSSSYICTYVLKAIVNFKINTIVKVELLQIIDGSVLSDRDSAPRIIL